MPARNARTREEHGRDDEKTEHRVHDSERIRDERTANIRGARMGAFGREKSENPRNVP